MIMPLDLQPVAQTVKKSVLCAALTAAHHVHRSEPVPLSLSVTLVTAH